MRYLEAGLLIAAQTVGPAYSVRVVDLGQGSVVRPFELPADSCGLSRKEITRQLEQSIVTTVSAEVAAPRLPRISFRRTTSSVASDDPFERMDTTIQAKFSRPLPTSGSSLQVVFVHPGFRRVLGGRTVQICKPHQGSLEEHRRLEIGRYCGVLGHGRSLSGGGLSPLR